MLIVFFYERTMHHARSHPRLPTYHRCRVWDSDNRRQRPEDQAADLGYGGTRTFPVRKKKKRVSFAFAIVADKWAFIAPSLEAIIAEQQAH